jgi:hypothetical protein
MEDSFTPYIYALYCDSPKYLGYRARQDPLITLIQMQPESTQANAMPNFLDENDYTLKLP